MLKPNSQGGCKVVTLAGGGVTTHRMHTYTQEIVGADVLETLLCLSFEEEEEGAVSVITDSGGWVGEGGGGILVVMCLLL